MRKARKSIHTPADTEPLEVQCLKDGTLDCCLETGDVFSVRRGKRTKMRLRTDVDGYLGFSLNRERATKRGKPWREMRDGKERLRYRSRRYVLVNRLIKIKALAVAKGGDNWRSFVSAKPLRGLDVNHIGKRSDNRNCMLELQTERANRSRSPMTDEEYAELQASF